MVKHKHALLDWSIKNTEMRIKKGEEHGEGDFVIREKFILKKQKRKKELQNR